MATATYETMTYYRAACGETDCTFYTGWVPTREEADAAITGHFVVVHSIEDSTAIAATDSWGDKEPDTGDADADAIAKRIADVPAADLPTLIETLNTYYNPPP